MKVFRVRTEGYKTALEFLCREDFESFIDSITDLLEWVRVEVKETKV